MTTTMMNPRLAATALVVACAVLGGCGKTTVFIDNQTNNNFGEVKLKSKLEVNEVSSKVEVSFKSVNKGTVSADTEWPDDDRLSVMVDTDSPGTDETPGTITLEKRKKNRITLRNGKSSSETVVSVSGEAILRP